MLARLPGANDSGGRLSRANPIAEMSRARRESFRDTLRQSWPAE
jgi:hypothetical protein